MAHIKVKQGLDIPLQGRPVGGIEGELPRPREVALNLTPFESVRFKLLVAVGDTVRVGQPLAFDRGCGGRMFVSPAAGVVKEVRRGEKRRLLDIVIGIATVEDDYEHPAFDINGATRDAVIDRLLATGLFAHIRQRPFNTLADPYRMPRSIFVKAVETAPFAVPAELSVEGNEDDFREGLTALGRLTDGPVHLVHHRYSNSGAFLDASSVTKHDVEGPHPAANASLHIYSIDPILSSHDVVWTLGVNDVVAIGHMMRTGTYFVRRVISVAGEGVPADKRGFFVGRQGYPARGLAVAGDGKGSVRIVSGDVLSGDRVSEEDFLHFGHTAFCAIPESEERAFLHFIRPAVKDFSASRTTLSGWLSIKNRVFGFTTRQHGEYRYFVDGTLYQKVMPMRIPVMSLIRAIQAKDYDLAEKLGLLEVDAEDFALPAFVCPCKMEMSAIVRRALDQYAQQMR